MFQQRNSGLGQTTANCLGRDGQGAGAHSMRDRPDGQLNRFGLQQQQDQRGQNQSAMGGSIFQSHH